MYQRKGRRYGAAMVALSLCLRLGIFLGLDAKAAAMLSQAARQEEFAAWMLYLETGKRAAPEEETQPVYVLELTRAPEEEGEEEPAEAEEEVPRRAQGGATAPPPPTAPTPWGGRTWRVPTASPRTRGPWWPTASSFGGSPIPRNLFRPSTPASPMPKAAFPRWFTTP